MNLFKLFKKTKDDTTSFLSVTKAEKKNTTNSSLEANKETPIAEIKEKNKEKCIKSAMEKRGWSREKADIEIEKAVKNLGITYKMYDSKDFCLLNEEEQLKKAAFLKDLDAKQKDRNKHAVHSVMQKMQWTEKEAKEAMQKAKKEIGIDFESFDRYDFALLSESDQVIRFNEVKDEIQMLKRERRQKTQSIWETMWYRNLDQTEAESEVEETLRELGITYQQYNKYRLFCYEPSDKAWAYTSKIDRAEKTQHERNGEIAAIASTAGLTPEEVIAKFEALKENINCRWHEFVEYQLYTKTDEEINELFLMENMNKIMKKYNKDKRAVRIASNKEWSNTLLKKYIKRKWHVNRNFSFEEFKMLFEGEPGIIYKPSYGLQARGVEALYFDGDMESVYKKVMSYPRGVLEQLIHQHPKMNELNPTSVNCLRICTISSRTSSVLKNGAKKDVAYVSVKIGRSGHIADNVIAGGMVANVDLETGIIITDAVNHEMEVIEIHPDTGTKIKGFQIPYFKEALDLVYTMIDELDLCGTIGWDMSISETGPEVVEPNFGPAASLFQTPWYPLGKGQNAYMSKYLWEE